MPVLFECGGCFILSGSAYCSSSVESTRTTLVIRGLLRLVLSVRAQMADEADPGTEGSGTERTWDKWDVTKKTLPSLHLGWSWLGRRH